jgi:hypothetical protein
VGVSSSPHSLSVAPILLAPLFSYHIIWFVEIYVKRCSLKLFSVRAITKVARNTAGGAKFTYFHQGACCPCCGMGLRATSTPTRERKTKAVYLYCNLRIRESLRLPDYNQMSKRHLHGVASIQLYFHHRKDIE